jgi:hypothetical protein
MRARSPLILLPRNSFFGPPQGPARLAAALAGAVLSANLLGDRQGPNALYALPNGHALASFSYRVPKPATRVHAICRYRKRVSIYIFVIAVSLPEHRAQNGRASRFVTLTPSLRQQRIRFGMGATYGPGPFRSVVKEQRPVPLKGAYDGTLEGITVVPLLQEVAPPSATRQLADHGVRDERGRRAA